MPSHQDFILPGIRADPTNSRLRALIVLAAFAYSREWNRRRLECHWYGLWSEILSDLLFDLAPNVFLVPQHTIYLNEGQTLDPDLSIRTVAEGNANERTPDFVALVAAVAPRRDRSLNKGDSIFPSSYSNWSTMRVVACFPAMIVQVKRSPRRSLLKQDDFIDDLYTCLELAADEADDSAALAFSDNKNNRLQKLVLLAVSGEWWKFKVALRNHYRFDVDSDSEREDEKEKKKNKARKKGKGKTQPKLTGQLFQRHEDLGRKEMVQPEPDANTAMPSFGKWSRFILFGTPASNQRFFLIHELLKGIQQDLIDEVGKEVDHSDESSEDPLAGYDVPS